MSYPAEIGQNQNADSWWLPNPALTLATLGAIMVAGRVAWDYHGRGLNERQREEVNETVSSSSLNPTQQGEVAQIAGSSGLNSHQQEAVNEILSNASLNGIQTTEVANAIQFGGLTQRQKDDLRLALRESALANIVESQKVLRMAIDQLRKSSHGHVAVINAIGVGRLDV